jgi:SAM-dependent methyltransferase
VTTDEAVRLLAPALAPGLLRWADLGAGSGTFTEALIRLLPPGASVVAVDRDPDAVERLRRLARRTRGRISLQVTQGDLTHPAAIPEVAGAPLDGVLFANVLHFFSDPSALLVWAASRLSGLGRVVAIEYEGRAPSPWVPHPLPPERLADVAAQLGLSAPEVVSEVPSRFRGRLYCAVVVPGRGREAAREAPRPR